MNVPAGWRPADGILLSRSSAEGLLAVHVDAAGSEIARRSVDVEWVRNAEYADHPRWILRSARDIYPELLSAGIRLSRSHDLLLCHAILRDTDAVPRPLAPSVLWLPDDPAAVPAAPGLFDVVDERSAASVGTLLEQLQEQRRVIGSDPTHRLVLLCAAESAGGLIAEEMRAAGLPWSESEHDRILTEVLGRRPAGGGPPEKLAAATDAVRFHLGDSHLHLDSHPRLLRALHRVGVNVESTSRWELREVSHPVIPPLLAYKKLSRLMAANGWSWLSEWVHEGRFRPVYIPGGVVTGRWASAGGGALQLPRVLRSAVRADDGWTLIVADVAQLEPRMLAALAGDMAMAEAARGQDLYAGVVASGAVATRDEAKFAVLGAMYGATTGDSGRLVPRLRKVYQRAMKVVDTAARIGENGGVVSTRLGRSSPRPDQHWHDDHSAAASADADPALIPRVRARSRERGRFTRNFVVQGTAAEWALIWLAEIRHRLQELPPARTAAPASGPFGTQAHLAFFLHDEVILHVPEEQADAAAEAVRTAAAVATRRIFGTFPIDVPLDLKIVASAEK
ncbi:bifunctional 3'-5' exonuclease/DNA polymerase [Microbacterium sp. GXF6406]